MFKRAWIYVKRKKSKTIILTIILFVIANLVLASMAIGNATEEAMKFARVSLGSEVTLVPDLEKMRAEKMSQLQEGGMNGYGRLLHPVVYLEDVQSLLEIDVVEDFRYGFTFNADAVDFEPFDSGTDEQEMSQFKEKADIGKISVQSYNAYVLIDGVSSGSIELVEGEPFTEENENDAIISYSLAYENDLELGDTITVETNDFIYEETKAATFTVIGIYDTVVEENGAVMKLQEPENIIYTNIKAGEQLLVTEAYNDGNYELEGVSFYLNDPKNIDTFLEEANIIIPDLADRSLLLDVNNAAYDQMTGPIEAVGEFSKTILILVIMGSVIILSLLIMNQIKDRNYEIGVLLSLGERRKNIIAQFLVELAIVATLGFLLSFGTSSFLSGKIGENLLENQIVMAEEQGSNDQYGMGRKFYSGDTTNVEAIDELDISIKTSDYFMLLGIGYLIIVLSMLIPASKIMKYEPKTILSGKE